jgi:hypothetical protein
LKGAAAHGTMVAGLKDEEKPAESAHVAKLLEVLNNQDVYPLTVSRWPLAFFTTRSMTVSSESCALRKKPIAALQSVSALRSLPRFSHSLRAFSA